MTDGAAVASRLGVLVNYSEALHARFHAVREAGCIPANWRSDVFNPVFPRGFSAPPPPSEQPCQHRERGSTISGPGEYEQTAVGRSTAV